MFVEVGDVGHLHGEAAFLGAAHFALGGDLQLAEMAAEIHLLFVGYALVVEDQHAVAVHAGFDLAGLAGGDGFGQVYAGNLTDEDGVKRVDLEGHGWTVLALGVWRLGGTVAFGGAGWQLTAADRRAYGPGGPC